MEHKGPNEFRSAVTSTDINDIPTEAAEFALLNTKAHPLAYDLQDVLAELLDMDGIYIKGGAVRNMMTGHKVDEIDAFFDITQSGLLSDDDLDPEEIQESLKYIARLINSSEHFEDCQIYFEGEVDGVPILNLRGEFVFDGERMPVDINMVTHEVSVWGCVYELSSASILSACMDPNGDCWARPDFEDHLRAKLLIPDTDKDVYAQERLRFKCDNQYGPKYGWKYVHPSEAHKYKDQLKTDRSSDQQEPII